MTNEELVIRIRDGETDRLIELWQQVEQFVKQRANRFIGYAEYDDLVQQGFLFLYSAISSYDESRGANFLTYYNRLLTWNWIRWIKNTGQDHRDLSLNMVIENDSGGTELQDLIPDETDFTTEVLDQYRNDQLSTILWSLVKGLGEMQADVLVHRYIYRETMKETAQSLGLTLNQARGAEAKAFRFFRHNSKARRLKEFLDCDLRSRALHGTGFTSFIQSQESSTEREAIRNIEGLK